MCVEIFCVIFCIPGEIRHAEWTEIDFETHEWRISAEKMKMKRVHIVPLATQTIELLRFLQEWMGNSMSENTIRAALHSMEYMNNYMTAHSFRSMTTTRLNEMGWTLDVIERRLKEILLELHIIILSVCLKEKNDADLGGLFVYYFLDRNAICWCQRCCAVCN